MVALLLVSVLAASPDAVPSSLNEARKLSEALRYEEASVEYQRYLAIPERPVRERALALLELSFIHLLLDDEVNAEARAIEALELDEGTPLPTSAPGRQREFVDKMREKLKRRTRLSLLPPDDEEPERVRVRLKDPERVARGVLLRHAVSQSGPYYATPMKCAGDACEAKIPSPAGANPFTAWYYAEANGADGTTLSRTGSPVSPAQVSVLQRTPWYKSPFLWGGAALVIVGGAAAVYATSGTGR